MKFMTPRNLRLIFPVLTLCALLPASAWGKTHWKDGYIVRANGDTLTGQIAFTEHNRSPGNITFRPLPGAPGKQYHPADLQAFKVKLDYQDIYFRSVKTEIDMSPTDLSAIDNLPKPVMEEHEFFAQLLTGGKRELYAYQEPKEHKRHYLVAGSDGKLTDLIHKRYFQDANHAQPVYFDGFKEQLIKLYTDCPAINFQLVNQTAFGSAQLITLAQKYNACGAKEPDMVYTFKQEKMLVHFGFCFGPNTTSMTIRSGSAGYDGITGLSVNPSYSLDAGAFLNLVIPHTDKRWAIYNDLLVRNYAMKSNSFHTAPDETASCTIKATYLKLFTALRYQYPYTRVKPFLQAGMGNGFVLSSSTTTQIHSSYAYVKDHSQPLTDFRGYEESYFVGAGASFKHFEAEFRLEHGNGFSQYDYLGTYAHYYSLLFKYAIR